MSVKLILHTGECERPDDPTMPFRLDLSMRHPEFMIVASVCMHGGSERVVARADTANELTDWMRTHGLDRHLRLNRWTITGPDGEVASSEPTKPEKTGG